MRQIARRLTLQQAPSPQAYLAYWTRLRVHRATVPPAPVRYRLNRLTNQRSMSIPVSGEKLTLWRAQNGRCYYCCGSLLPRYHVDHMHPKSKGGANALSNYCLACQPCNHAKRDRSVMTFALSLLS